MNGRTRSRPYRPGLEPSGLSLAPIYDWFSTLGAAPEALYLKIGKTRTGAVDCGLPLSELFTLPEVACVDVAVINQTGLDIPVFLIEAFWQKEGMLPAYEPPSAGQVAADQVSGELIESPKEEPGPLWLLPPGQFVTIALPLGGADTAVELRAMVQREICDNARDDDGDGRVDEGCGSVLDGDVCVVDLDCASRSCVSDVCQTTSGSWVTLGVYEVTPDMISQAHNGRLSVTSLPASAWPLGYVSAGDKIVHGTRLELLSIGSSAEACGLIPGPPYDEQVLCPSLRVTSEVAAASSSGVLIEFLDADGTGMPFRPPYQRVRTFDVLPAAAFGVDPVPQDTINGGVVGVERDADGSIVVTPPAPLIAGDSGSRLLIRVVRPEFKDVSAWWDGPSENPISSIPPWAIVPGNPGDECSSACSAAIARGESCDENTNSSDWELPSNVSASSGMPEAPPAFARSSACFDDSALGDAAVYDVVEEFGTMLLEIGWTPEYLVNEFIAQAHTEEDALEYMIETWGQARLSEVFPGFSEIYGARRDVAGTRELLARPTMHSGWSRLLRPDPSGVYDSYWGLRVLGEHGSLVDRILVRQRGEPIWARVATNCRCGLEGPACAVASDECLAEFGCGTQENATDTTPVRFSESPSPLCSCDGIDASGSSCRWDADVHVERQVVTYRPIPGEGRVPTERMYVLPGGNYRVLTTSSSSATWAYHGPLPDYCDPLWSERGTNLVWSAEANLPDRRYGWPPLAFYGWSNVVFDGCGSEIEFSVPAADERSANPFRAFPPDVLASAEAFVPACVQTVSDEGYLKVLPAYTPQSIRILGGDDIVIRNVELTADVDSFQFRYERALTSRNAEVDEFTYDTRRGEAWNDFAVGGEYGADWHEMLPSGLRVTDDCASVRDDGTYSMLAPYLADGDAEPADEIGAILVTGLPSGLDVSDSHGVLLENVGVTGSFDGLRVGDNGVSAQCPAFTPSSRFDNSSLSGDDRHLVATRPIPTPSASSLHLHEASSGTGQWEGEDENPHLGRWPEERFGVRGLCDVTPCPVTDLRVVSSSFAGFGRNSATLGHLRRAVFHATTFRDSGLSLRARPIFYSSPGFGVDGEPGDGRSAIRVLDRLGQRGRLLSGQLNFVHSHFRNDRGGAFTFNSKAGVYEQLRILHSDILVAPALEPPDKFGALAFSANWDCDFVCNRFRIGEGRNLEGWYHGGSGVFSRNLVTGEGDVTLGLANTGCREQGYTTAVEDDIEAEFCEDINLPGAGYRGASPYPRCEDLMECGYGTSVSAQPAIRCNPSGDGATDAAHPQCNGELELAGFNARLPLIDVDWRVPASAEDEEQRDAVPFAETQVRVVTDNTFVIGEYAYWGGLERDTWRVEGDELEINADWVQNNTVCFYRHEYARDPAYSPSITFGLPWLRGAAHGTTVVNGDLSLVDGTNYSCVQSAALTAPPAPANFPAPYGDVCSDAEDPDACLRAWFAETCQEDAAASALFPWDDLVPSFPSFALWSLVDVGSAYDALLASSSASWGADLWPTGGLRIPGAAAKPATNYRSLAVPDELANVSAHWFARPRPPEACSPGGGIVDNAGCPPDSQCRAVSGSVSSHICMRECSTHDDCPGDGLCLDSPEPERPGELFSVPERMCYRPEKRAAVCWQALEEIVRRRDPDFELEFNPRIATSVNPIWADNYWWFPDDRYARSAPDGRRPRDYRLFVNIGAQ